MVIPCGRTSGRSWSSLRNPCEGHLPHHCKEELVSRFDHAAYLGRELQKAEVALKNRLEYTQDEEIVLRGKKKGKA